MISRIPLAFQILNIQESESGLPEQFCYRKLKTGQTINLVKPLLGLMLQHKGVKTSNRCPCLLPHRQWRGEWGGDLVLGVKVGADPRVGLEGCFGCFVHLPGVAVCKDHVQYPAFGPSSSDVIVGCLVFCILFIICPDSACIRYFQALIVSLLLDEMFVKVQTLLQRVPGPRSQPVTEQDPARPSQDRAPDPFRPSAFCLYKNFSKNTFNQRSDKMQKERKTVKQDKIIILWPLNSQGRTFSSSSRTIDNILNHVL